MIIYQIKNVWNFDSFPNCQFLFEIAEFQKFNYFMNLSIMEI